MGLRILGKGDTNCVVSFCLTSGPQALKLMALMEEAVLALQELGLQEAQALVEVQQEDHLVALVEAPLEAAVVRVVAREEELLAEKVEEAQVAAVVVEARKGDLLAEGVVEAQEGDLQEVAVEGVRVVAREEGALVAAMEEATEAIRQTPEARDPTHQPLKRAQAGKRFAAPPSTTSPMVASPNAEKNQPFPPTFSKMPLTLLARTKPATASPATPSTALKTSLLTSSPKPYQTPTSPGSMAMSP